MPQSSSFAARLSNFCTVTCSPKNCDSSETGERDRLGLGFKSAWYWSNGFSLADTRVK